MRRLPSRRSDFLLVRENAFSRTSSPISFLGDNLLYLEIEISFVLVVAYYSPNFGTLTWNRPTKATLEGWCYIRLTIRVFDYLYYILTVLIRIYDKFTIHWNSPKV